MLADVERIGELRRAELTERLALLEDLLHGMLPDWRWRQPKGGLSIWARLPAGSAADLAQVAGRRGVLIAPGPLMSPTGRFDEFIRLPFDHEPAVLREGVRRLASAWQSYAAALGSYGSSRMDVIVLRAAGGGPIPADGRPRSPGLVFCLGPSVSTVLVSRDRPVRGERVQRRMRGLHAASLPVRPG
jgi:hypothetical protein